MSAKVRGRRILLVMPRCHHGEVDMSRLMLRVHEWLADHSSLQYPPRMGPGVVEPIHKLHFPDFVIVMQTLALATCCLLVAVPLLVLCGLLLDGFCVAL